MTEAQYEAALSLIDEAHAQDPTIAIINNKDIPYELHYAQRSTHWLSLRCPQASNALKTAVRAQHFRRWEIPRSSYPDTKAGYFAWRTFLKKRQGDLAAAICVGCNIPASECDQISALIRKEDLKKNEETQILEDVACLVFLDDQFDKFEKDMGEKLEGKGFNEQEAEEKKLVILRKTWAKMSPEGRDLALKMDLSDKGKELVGKALAG